jgi:ligand-binding sensor domain-containing protein/signal transduction histidine kinase
MRISLGLLVFFGMGLLGESPSRAASLRDDLTTSIADHALPLAYAYYQDNDIRFEKISVEAGLSQSTVLCVEQDQRGFIWFGTQDGLNRYDGYDFLVFEHEPDNPTSLSDNTVLALFEDRNGTLWVGTDGGGLDRFDHISGEFIHYRSSQATMSSLSDDSVFEIYEDSLGWIWVGTRRGLNRMDSQFETFEHMSYDFLNEAEIFAILEDRTGLLWIGTNYGLVSYDRQNEFYTHYINNPANPASLGGDRVNALYEDAEGILWIGTGDGLNRFNRGTNNFTRYQMDADDKRSLIDDRITAIYGEPYDALWVGTEAGLDRFDPYSGEFVHYQNDPGIAHSLSNNHVQAVYVDREGVLWVGTESGGVNKSSLGRGKFTLLQSRVGDPDSLSDNIVRAIFEDHEGIIWIGTSKGLDGFDRATGLFTHYRHDSEDASSLSDDFVLSIYEDSRGTLWVGTLHGGVNKFDRQTGGFSHYRHNFRDPLSISDDTIRVIFEDSQGILWFGTNHGLNRFDRNSEIFNSYLYFKDLGRRTVRSIIEDQDGVLWVGADDGLFEYDRQSDHFLANRSLSYDPEMPSNDLVLCVQVDRQGDLWMGTFQGGLVKVDARSDEILHYRKSDGLPNDVVYGILEDEQGFLWLSTVRGLSRLDPQSGTFKNFDITDGLQSYEFNEGAYHQSASGEMFFGGINGLNSFFPDDLTANEYVPPVVLTSLTQGGEAVEREALIDQLTTVTFGWPENFFEFEFAALSLEQPEDNQYAYRLKGFETEWNQVGNRNFGRYTNLPGGRYTLQIKGSNNDGIWNEDGASLNVIINPPFWRTGWFGILAAVLLAAGLVGGYRWRVRNIEQRSHQLEELVDQRTAELSRSNLRLTSEINERQRAEQELAHQAADVAVAEERNRLARDLHDAVSQTLFSASLIAEVLPKLWGRDRNEGERRVAELRELTRGALAEMRTLLLELRPTALEDAELGELLKQLAESITGRARVPVTVELRGDCDLTPDVKIAFYRIAQEALNNIAKHSGAEGAMINYDCQPEQISLSIEDDGAGFEPAEIGLDSLGLGIMRERAEAIAATLEINSQTGQGTQINVTWHTNKDGE